MSHGKFVRKLAGDAVFMPKAMVVSVSHFTAVKKSVARVCNSLPRSYSLAPSHASLPRVLGALSGDIFISCVFAESLLGVRGSLLGA
jgi:hypothetical protein